MRRYIVSTPSSCHPGHQPRTSRIPSARIMGNRLKTGWVGKREETGEKLWWRRERDSNPRCRYKRHTRFPVVLLQPTRTSLRIGQTKPNRAGAEPPSNAEANRSWRRGWDSNPRSRFWQDTAFRERGLQPLGHLSCPLTGTSTASSVKKYPISFLRPTCQDASC